MCLKKVVKYDILRRFKPRIENGNYVGWKLFKKTKHSNELYSVFYGDGIFPINKWVNEINFRGSYLENGGDSDYIFDGKIPYKTGFHIYIDDIKLLDKYYDTHGRYEFRKVYFKKVVAKGYQDRYKVIVAKEMMIPKEPI